MAHCIRCEKFMLFNSSNGYCTTCAQIIKEESRRREEEVRYDSEAELYKPRPIPGYFEVPIVKMGKDGKFHPTGKSDYWKL